jgi:hypothetical protein
MMAKRGLQLTAIHFASPPYTSEMAEEKVISLLRQLARYAGRISLAVVPFTRIQEQIADACPEELFTLLMRRCMMRIAQRVAEKLYAVSENRQVMCVTHLPQIAAMADTQYLVAKSESSGRTFTRVTALDEEGRKKEIARLFGGDHITATTLAAASEQLAAAKQYKLQKQKK